MTLWMSLTAVSSADEPPLPLTLPAALELFRRQNLQLVAERFQVEAARADQITARLFPNPQLSLNGTYLEPQTPKLGDAQFSARVDWLIETAGKRTTRTEGAEAAARVEEEHLFDVVRQLTMDVKEAFYSILLAREHLHLSQENLRRFDEILRINQIRFQGGGISEADLIKTRLQKLNYQNDVITATLELRTAENRLKSLLGLPPSQVIDVQGDLGRRPPLPPLPELREQALAARPDLKSQQEAVRQLESQLRLAKAQRVPDVTVGVEYDTTGPDYHPALGGGLSVPLPIFNRNQGEVLKAQKLLDAAHAQRDLLTQQIGLETEQAYHETTENLTLVSAFESGLLNDAQETLTIAERAYQKGGTTLLDLLEAERTFNTTRLNYAQALFNVQKGFLDLEGAVGTELEHAAP